MKHKFKEIWPQVDPAPVNHPHFWIITLLVYLLLMVTLSSCAVVKVVTFAEATRIAEGGAFDAKSYVESKWPEVSSTIIENAVELSSVLNAIQIDANGLAKKANLKQVADKFGLTTVGEAHVFMVKGQGTVTAVDTESRTGTIEITLENYSGPIKVKVFSGPRLPSDETAVRDAVGFIQFGDFKEQTEYGKVARELNKRVLDEVLANLATADLLGQTVSLRGVFTIRTFNKPGDININEILITPVQIEVGG
jgi:predicted lipoprotein